MNKHIPPLGISFSSKSPASKLHTSTSSKISEFCELSLLNNKIQFDRHNDLNHNLKIQCVGMYLNMISMTVILPNGYSYYLFVHHYSNSSSMCNLVHIFLFVCLDCIYLNLVSCNRSITENIFLYEY